MFYTKIFLSEIFRGEIFWGERGDGGDGGNGGDGPAKLKNRLEPSDDCPANGENCKDDNDDEDNNMKI